MKTTYKSAKTTKEYKTKFAGWDIIVPVGSIVNNIVNNSTALGYDDNYRFWQDYQKVTKQLTGFDNNILDHDLYYYGLNIPAEYCEPYKKDD